MGGKGGPLWKQMTFHLSNQRYEATSPKQKKIALVNSYVINLILDFATSLAEPIVEELLLFEVPMDLL
jgi:hypothetical protein